MILDDMLQVVYAPVKVFKKIIENPKYLGAFVILLLFIGVQVGYEYVQFSKTYSENTSPFVYQLPTFTNATYWNSTSNIVLSDNYNDFFNYSIYAPVLGTTPGEQAGYYSLFGNSSLEINATNSNSVSAALDMTAALIASSNGTVSSVDCNAPSGFQNLSMTIKQVEPTVAPQSATLTLYSVSGSNSYQYDLTSDLSNTADIGLWNNLTIPVGQNAQGWTSSSVSPSWGNVTALQLTLNYPASSNITIRIGALFFRGQYQTPIQYNSTGLILESLQVFSIEFILTWLLITILIYLLFKGLKTNIIWKPLFIASGFALFVLVIRALVNLIAAATLPTLYYPFDISVGVSPNIFGALSYPSAAVSALSTQSQAILNSINSATANFRFVISAVFVVGYLWLGGLSAIIIGTLKPEFSKTKRIAISEVSIGVTILLLLLLGVFV